MMKRLLSLLLVAVLLLSLAACDKEPTVSDPMVSDTVAIITSPAEDTDIATTGENGTDTTDADGDTTVDITDTTDVEGSTTGNATTTLDGNGTVTTANADRGTTSGVANSTTIDTSDKESTVKNTSAQKTTNKTTTQTTVKTTTGKTNSATTGNAPTASTAPQNKPMPSAPAFKPSEYLKNKGVWATKLIGEQFHFEIQMISLGVKNEGIVQRSVAKQNIGSPVSLLPHKNQVGEWGFSFYHLNNRVDGANRPIQSGFHPAPTSRSNALSQIREFLSRQYFNVDEADWWYSMTGHYPYQHYAAAFGADVVGSELGENVYNYQMSVAFNRGAARQYNIPWFIDFSSWYGGVITDYSKDGTWGLDSGAEYGHSGNLMARTYLMAYMAGAASIIAEAGASIAFYDDIDPQTGLYKVSPYGDVCRDFNVFTQKLKDVGTAYTPFGIVLDFYHGLHAGDGGQIGWSKDLVFQYFPRTEGDRFNQRVLETFYPEGFDGTRDDETECMRNNPYGDTADVITHNASATVLNSYPCLILAGNLQLTAAEVKKYEDYVRQGGTLLLNSAYTSQFSQFSKSTTYGAGEVIVYGPDYSVEGLDAILKKQLVKLVPFTFSEQVEYLVNVKEKSLLVTVINNNGVEKNCYAEPDVDASQAKDIIVTYTGGCKVTSVKEWYAGQAVRLVNNGTQVHLDPGEGAVLEFCFA